MNALEFLNIQNQQEPAVQVTSVIQSESLAMENGSCCFDSWTFWYKSKPLKFRQIEGVSIAEISKGPYIFRSDTSVHYCGDDEAWALCEGKDRAWIWKLFDWVMKPCMDAGLSAESVTTMKVKHLLEHFWAFQILGGQFVSEGQTETCSKKNDHENLSIQF